MAYDGSVKFIYTCKESQPYKGTGSSFPELLPDETITIESPSYDLNIHQYFHLFRKFLGALGFNEQVILAGAFHFTFSDSNTKEFLDKLMDEYEIQDRQYYTTEDYEDLDREKKKLESEIRDLKAKLSRCENPDNPQYTEEEIAAMTAEATDGGYKPWGDYVPGSREAVMLGCVCPVHDNAEMPDDRKWVSADCPLHGKK